jgi:NADH dehydrogenase FAD-containing subunit
VVAGGGAAGLEIAANLRRLAESASGRAEIALVAGGRLVAGMPPGVRRRALRKLGRRGVRVIEGARVTGWRDGRAELSTGEQLAAHFLLMAVGVKPLPLFAESGLPTGADGGLLVNDFLQSTAHPEIFGGGDCISLASRPLAKVGVYAVRQNPVLLHNLMAALQGGDLMAFRPQPHYLLAFNMGDGTAIVSWRSLVFGGPLGFALKNHLDRRFMRRFQE